jgi:hypothetical protein
LNFVNLKKEKKIELTRVRAPSGVFARVMVSMTVLGGGDTTNNGKAYELKQNI